MSYEKIVVITRQTRLEALVARYNTRSQARFVIEHSGGDFDLYQQEHETYYAALSHLRRELQKLAKVQVVERDYLPNFLFGADDLVLTVGVDGLVVNTAKYLDGQPLLAVNPDPTHIDGVLLPFTVEAAPHVARRAQEGTLRIRPISMAQATLNDGQSLLAFNDLFIGRHDHLSARYRIRVEGRSEVHSSSGVIVSTGAGSTGWLSSLFNMAEGMLARFGGDAHPLPRPELTWEAEQLVYVVREPFVSKTSGADIVCGVITPENPLLLESTMPAGGVIFSDGVPADYLAFNSGSVATIALAAKKTNLIVD